MNDRRILVIDDIREYEGAVHARTSAIGLELLQSQQWDEVWLDHDLGGEDTIRPVVNWLDEHELDIEIGILTANPVGFDYIRLALGRKYPIALYPNGARTPLKLLKNV